MADGQETKKPEDAAPVSSIIDTSGDIAAAKADRDAGKTGLPKTDPEAVGVRNADDVPVEQKLDVPATPASTATATAPEPRKDEKKADAPEVQAPAAETEEEAAARKKKEAEANAQQQPTQPTPPPVDAEEEAKRNAPLTDEALRNSKFFVDFNTKHLPVLNEIWGVGDVDAALKQALGESGEIRKHKNGLLFDLPNGHTIEWHANLGGAEFIGMPMKSAKFDEHDAHAVVAASKSRGWQAITLYGNVEQKEMMWLEAMRQGVAVNNFSPREGSPVLEKWRQEKQLEADEQLVGISAAEHGPINLPKSMFVDTEALKETAPKQEAAAPQKDAPKETAPAEAAPQGSESFDEFLDRKISAAKGDPDLQKGLLAIREGIKNNAIPLDADGTAQLKTALGNDDGADRGKYQAAARELEGRVKDLKLPVVETKAATETPAPVTATATPVSSILDTSGNITAAKAARDAGQTGLPPATNTTAKPKILTV